MSESRSGTLPCVVLFNINGSGMGHLGTCLAYANRLKGRARPVFFSLASAIEMIHDMGFEADYMVSRFWSRASSWAWDQQLALRLGLLFERVRPDVVIFDGTWPYRGLLHAAKVYGGAKLVWSDLVLYKAGFRKVPVRDENFDLIIKLGEIGSSYNVERAGPPARMVRVPPATILRDVELLDTCAARKSLGLKSDARYALFALGPGNLKNVANIGSGLAGEMRKQGIEVIWLQAPISASDSAVPPGTTPMAIFPVARYLRAFDMLVSAAGYNTSCEILQSGIPALLVPNTLVSDDQTERARRVSEVSPAVVSACETPQQRAAAVTDIIDLASRSSRSRDSFDLTGADVAVKEVLALIGR